jgi:16S rRNA (cytidine1402-2'-O)-methyltransferase
MDESQSAGPTAGGLIQFIGTPIGNLGDITFRAVACLKAAHVIACEDTRHSQRLLQHLEIRDKLLLSVHDHNEQQRALQLVARAQQGERIVYLSDAGTPSIADPGYRLVNACIAAGVTVEVIPGPSAVTTALAGSGLPSDSFHFGGFLPVKSGRKEKILELALLRAETSIFFESPHRIAKTLSALAKLDPVREVCVARELTKRFETYHRGHAATLVEEFTAKPVKGEITLVIRGAGHRRDDPAEAAQKE